MNIVDPEVIADAIGYTIDEHVNNSELKEKLTIAEKVIRSMSQWEIEQFLK